MRFWKAAIMIGVFAACAVQAAHAGNAPKDDVEQIKAHYRSVEQALAKRDSVAAMSAYAKDVIVFDLGPPLSAVGHDKSVRTYDAAFGATTGPWLCEFTDQHIVADNDHAYAMSFVRLAYTTNEGQKVDMRVRITNIFEKQNGKWMVIHEHTSAPMDLATHKAVLDAPKEGEGKPFGNE